MLTCTRTEDDQLSDVDEPERREFLLVAGYFETLAANADKGTRFGDVYRPLILVPRNDPARWLFAASQQCVGFVGEAESGQRAADAFRAVDQGEWCGDLVRCGAGFTYGRMSPLEFVLGQLYRHASARFGIVQLGTVTMEAIVAQYYRL